MQDVATGQPMCLGLARGFSSSNRSRRPQEGTRWLLSCAFLSLSLFGLTLRSLANGGGEPATRDTARHSQRESEQIN